MSFMGHLFGMEIHVSEHCVERYTAFTRKQTRKFTNTRWTKKYLKKYSYEATKPSMVRFHNTLMIHPKAWEAIKEKANDLKNNKSYSHRSFRRDPDGIRRYEGQREYGVPAFGMGQRSVFAQPC